MAEPAAAVVVKEKSTTQAAHPDVVAFITSWPQELQQHPIVQQCMQSGCDLQTFLSTVQSGVPEVATFLSSGPGALQMQQLAATTGQSAASGGGAKEDPTYRQAENAIAGALAQRAAANITDETAPSVTLNPVAVDIEGAPRRQVPGFSQQTEGYQHGDPRERIDITITPEGDLRAAKEGDVRRETLAAVKALFEKIPLLDGTTLADKYNLTGEAQAATEGPKPIEPVVTMDTSHGSGKRNNDIHLMIDLPEGVSHTQVVRALAGKPFGVEMPAETAVPATTATAEANATALAVAEGSEKRFTDTLQPPGDTQVAKISDARANSQAVAVSI